MPPKRVPTPKPYPCTVPDCLHQYGDVEALRAHLKNDHDMKRKLIDNINYIKPLNHYEFV